MTENLDLILRVAAFMALLLPLGGFIVLSLFGDAIHKDKEDKGAGILACATVLVAFACSVAVVVILRLPGLDLARFRQVYELPERATPYQPYAPYLNFEWISVGPLRVPFALLLDQLSSVMLLVVTGVGSLIHIYSLGYMAHDEDRVRYFSYLNLFTFFMLLLVTGSSLPLMFVGWEGVGLCSYLLIGFWYKKKSASDAGMKAFVVNRIGDAGLILGTILAFYTLGSVDFVQITEAAAESVPREALGQFGPVTVIALLLFLGACGKSAQIPLHVWLPDAMEGPTPVSALIHAATMVTAGVYMVARLAPLFDKSETAMTVVAVVGAATALMAATVALVQTDIKRVLAYSTVSQLGYMFLACGVGAFGVGIFHLFTHAFFKALLFLGSGSVIHAMSGEQDMRKMGGLRKKIPWTFGTFFIGTLAIAGIPPLAGFFSKDEILAAAFVKGKTGLFAVGLVTALLTSFYMARLLFMTFFGRFRGDHETEHHVHESPPSMLVPLVILAVGSISVGWLHIPAFLTPVLRVAEIPGLDHGRWLPVTATLLAFAGIVVAGYLYVLYTGLPGRISAALAPLHRVLQAKWGFDDAYDWFVRRWVVEASDGVLWKGVDAGVIDGAVNGTADLVGGLARISRALQTGFVRGYVLLILGGAVALVLSMVVLR